MTDNLDALIEDVAGKPLQMARLAAMLVETKRDAAQARALCAAALALAPNEPEVAVLAAEVFCSGVPAWHFSLVRDDARNAAYDAALRRAVKPGSRVLEIGAGTGLVAMMAARAGAAEVVTCEMNKTVAERAQEVVARNGYADRVRVVVKHSDALEIGVDLSGPADVLVSEIVSNDLLSERVLPSLEGVVGRLTRPGAAIIPRRGAIRVALARDAKADDRRMGQVDGFDLSPFNRLVRPVYPIAAGDERLSLASEPGDLFSFDFRNGGPYPPARSAIELAAQSGAVNGVAQWIALDMDEQSRHENRPGPGVKSNWAVRFHPLPAGHKIAAGQIVTVCGSHARRSLRLWTQT